MPSNDQIKLVITDRFSLCNLSTLPVNAGDSEFAIRELTPDLVRWYIHNSAIFDPVYKVNSDYMRQMFKNLIEIDLELAEEDGIDQIAAQCSFLVIALNKHGQVKFFLIMDNNVCSPNPQSNLN